MIDIVWQSIVIHGLSYLIFAFLLGKILFDPVMSLIEKRSERVNKLVTAAERAGGRGKVVAGFSGKAPLQRPDRCRHDHGGIAASC